jgi:hypothetical protein
MKQELLQEIDTISLKDLGVVESDLMDMSSTENTVNVGKTLFSVGDTVQGKTKRGVTVQGPIVAIHPSVFGDHTAQVKIRSQGTLSICELIDLSHAKKI